MPIAKRSSKLHQSAPLKGKKAKPAVANVRKRALSKEPAPAQARAAAITHVRATQAKNNFGVILKSAKESGPVFIERHGKTEAVVLNYDSYAALVQKNRDADERKLQALRADFHSLYEAMQRQSARAVTDGLFAASDAEINRVAASQLRSRTDGGR